MKELIKYESNVLHKAKYTDEELLSCELELLIFEFRDIINTLYIYKQLSSEDDSANKFLFLTFYETIETSLVYRIVIGLSRLFDSNSSARTLRKVLNVLQQTRIVNGSKEINMALSEVLLDDSNVRDTYNFKNLRDKYFAHLDKEMVFSSLVIFKEIEYIKELITLLEKINDKLNKIYQMCFLKELPQPKYKNIEIPKISDLKDVKQRAIDLLDAYPYLHTTLAINETGLYYLSKEK